MQEEKAQKKINYWLLMLVLSCVSLLAFLGVRLVNEHFQVPFAINLIIAFVIVSIMAFLPFCFWIALLSAIEKRKLEREKLVS